MTVVLLPEGTTGSCEVRGGAPASRETALLDPTKLVEHVDAVVLTGGSAFGLATADGVMTALAALDRGFASSAGAGADRADRRDLRPARVGWSASDRAGRRRRARRRVAADAPSFGRVGAGTGATVGKWRGGMHGVPGGMGTASVRVGDATVGALAVVNAIGDVIGADGRSSPGSTARPVSRAVSRPAARTGENTTLVVVATDARCTKVHCHLLAQSAHDGLARSLSPVATRFDGDIAFGLATGAVDVHLDRLRLGVVEAVATAVRAAVA